MANIYKRNATVLLIVISLIIWGMLIFLGCNQTPKPVNPVCDQLTDSWICDRSRELGMEAENLYGLFFMSSISAELIDKGAIKDICEIEAEVAVWYDRFYPEINYGELIADFSGRFNLIKDPRHRALIRAGINANLMHYSSFQLITEDDDKLLRMGHERFRRELGCDL